MSFEIFTDSAANLPKSMVDRFDLHVVPLSYIVDGEELEMPDLTDFCGGEYYDLIRDKTEVKTSLVNSQRFEDYMIRALELGRDILYVGVSSGISGTYQAAKNAAAELRHRYPDRTIKTVDTLGASFGEGLFAMKAGEMRGKGMDITTVTDDLRRCRQKMCQYFTVDDLMFLKRGGRVSGVTAVLGTVLQIKPLLRGDEDGRIIVCGKSRGRKAAFTDMAELYAKKVVEPENQTVCIAHADSPRDAEYLAKLIREKAEPKEIVIEYYEPVTGAHVGPGTVAMFYWGTEK